jgi:hypothetical protein
MPPGIDEVAAAVIELHRRREYVDGTGNMAVVAVVVQ